MKNYRTLVSQECHNNGLAATYSVAVNKFLSMDGNPLGNLCSVVFHKDRSWDLFFFLLHFNDSANVLSKCNITKYADDTVLYYSHKDINEIEKVMPFEFNLFSNWLKENELILNCKKGKTEVMVFGTNPRLKNLNDPPLRIQHQFTEIGCTDSYKYLGLLLKSNLNLTEHIQQSISKASSRVYLLRKIRPMIDSKTSCKIFNAMILPFLTYCTFTIIGSIPEYLKSRILQLEARAQKLLALDLK